MYWKILGQLKTMNSIGGRVDPISDEAWHRHYQQLLRPHQLNHYHDYMLRFYMN